MSCRNGSWEKSIRVPEERPGPAGLISLRACGTVGPLERLTMALERSAAYASECDSSPFSS